MATNDDFEKLGMPRSVRDTPVSLTPVVTPSPTTQDPEADEGSALGRLGSALMRSPVENAMALSNAITGRDRESALGGEDSTRLGSFVGSISEGAARGLSSLPRAVEELGTGIYNVATGSDYDASEIYNPILDPIADRIDATFGAIASQNDEYADEFQSKLGQGLGSISATIAGGAVKGAVGAIGAGMAQIGQEGVEDYRRALKEQGAEFDGGEAFTTFLANAGVGITEGIPVMRAFDRLDKATGGTLDNAFGDILKGGVEEASQEVLQTTLSNLIASDLVAYDPERGTFEDTVEAATVGGGVGLIANAIMIGLGGRARATALEEAGEPRELGPIEKSLVANGIARPTSLADTIKQRQDRAKEQDSAASINPVTGEALQTKDVINLNKGLQQAERVARTAASAEDRQRAQEAANDYRSRLESIANQTAEEGKELSASETIAKQEAKQVLGRQEQAATEPEGPIEAAAPEEETIPEVEEPQTTPEPEEDAVVTAEDLVEAPTDSVPEAEEQVLEDEEIDAANQAYLDSLQQAPEQEAPEAAPEVDVVETDIAEQADEDPVNPVVPEEDVATPDNEVRELEAQEEAQELDIRSFLRDDNYLDDEGVLRSREDDRVLVPEVIFRDVIEAETLIQSGQDASQFSDQVQGIARAQIAQRDVDTANFKQGMAEDYTAYPDEYKVPAQSTEQFFEAMQEAGFETVVTKSGKPFKTEAAAKARRKAAGLTDTHNVVEVGYDAYALVQKPTNEQIEAVQQKAETDLRQEISNTPVNELSGYERSRYSNQVEELVNQAKERSPDLTDLEIAEALDPIDAAAEEQGLTVTEALQRSQEALNNLRGPANIEPVEPEAPVVPDEFVEPAGETAIAQAEETVEATPSDNPRTPDELMAVIQEEGIESVQEEIVRDYGSIKNFEELMSRPATLRPQQGIGVDEDVTEVPEGYMPTIQAGFDPETDQGIEDVTPEPAPEPKKDPALAKAEINTSSKIEQTQAQLAQLEEQLEIATNEGKNTLQIEKRIDQMNARLNVLNREQQKERDVKSGKAKKASDDEVDGMISGLENGTLRVEDIESDRYDDDYFQFIYGGPLATDQDAMMRLTKLERAISMAQFSEYTPEVQQRIRATTGWFRGPDNKWRFEIDDSGAQIIGGNLKQRWGDYFLKKEAESTHPNGWVTLGQVLDHPTLFESYPRLRDVALDADFMGGAGAGAFTARAGGGNGFLEIDESTPLDQALTTMLHEVQHAVQHIEGFARGGSTAEFRTAEYIEALESVDLAQEAVQSYEADNINLTPLSFSESLISWHEDRGIPLEDLDYKGYRLAVKTFARSSGLDVNTAVSEFENLIESGLDTPEYRRRVAEYKSALKRTAELNPSRRYERLLGEVEARDVEARRELSDIERQMMVPYTSQGIPESEFLILDQNERYIAQSLPDWATQEVLPPNEVPTKNVARMPNGVVRYNHSAERSAEFDKLAAKYAQGAAKFGARVVAVNNLNDLPMDVKRGLGVRYGKEGPLNAWGLFHSKSNTIYIMKQAIPSPKLAETTLIHEIVGHFGMKNMFEAASGGDSSAYTNFLMKESKRSRKLMSQAVEVVYARGYRELFTDTRQTPRDLQFVVDGKTRYLTEDNAAAALDEYIALRAEDIANDSDFQKKNGGFIKRLMVAIRHMFTKLGFQSKNLTEQDVLTLIAESNVRLFNVENRSAVGHMQGGKGLRYHIAKYTDPNSPHFLPDAARIHGVAPRGAFAAEQAAVAKFEENYTPLQKEASKAKERAEESTLGTILDLVDSGFAKTTTNKWEQSINDMWAKTQTHPFMEWVSQFGALGRLSHKDAYRNLNSVARGEIARGEAKAKSIDKVLKKLDGNQKKAAQAYFTTKDADPATIPGITASERTALASAKKTIEQLGAELVRMGKLSPEVYEASRGMYLPKVYFKYINQSGTSGKRISFMSYLRKQKDLSHEERVELGKIEDPSLIVPDTIGTISRDIALLKLTNNIINFSTSRQLGWVLGEQFKVKYVTSNGKQRTGTIYSLANEVERLREQMSEGVDGPLHNNTEADLDHIAKRIAYLDTLVAKAEQGRIEEVKQMLRGHGLTEAEITPEQVKKYMDDNYVKMPYDYAYGALSGKWVMKAIKNDFVDSQRTSQEIEEAVNSGDPWWKNWTQASDVAERFHQYWKASKVVFNVPVSTIRNLAGNYVLMDTSTNTNAGRLLLNTWEEIAGGMEIGGRTPSRFWKYAEDTGLFGTTFSATELNRLKRTKASEINHQLKMAQLQNKQGKLFHTGALQFMRSVSNLANTLSEFYGWQEGLLKVVKMRDTIETWEKQNGRSVEDLPFEEKQAVLLQATLEANDAIFDYSEVAGWVRHARRTPVLGSPFLTFTYKALMKMPENFAKHPHKFIKYVAVTSATVASAIGAMVDGEWDDEEVDQAMRTMSDYYRDSSSVVLLPYKDSNGRLQIIDLSPFYPWAPFMNMMKGSANRINEAPDAVAGTLGVGSEMLEWSGFLSTPLLDFANVMTTNKDPFTGQEIIRENGTGAQQLSDWAQWAYETVAPPVLTEQGALGHVLDNFGIDAPLISSGRELNRLGQDRETGTQAASRVFGLNIRPQDARLNTANTMAGRNAEIRKLQEERSKYRRDPNLSPEQRASKMREVNERLKQTHEKYRKRLVGRDE